MTHPNFDKLVKALEMFLAIETNPRFATYEYMEGTGFWKDFGEAVMATREAIASHQSAPSKPTDEKRAALDALHELHGAMTHVEKIAWTKNVKLIEAALTTPPDNVGDDVVEMLRVAAKDLELIADRTGADYDRKAANSALTNVALLEKNGGG